MLSVLLPFRDVAPWLEAAIASTLADPACDELVAIDDGSRDDSLAVAERVARADRRVVIVRREESGGVAAALAAGLAVARGELVGRMDGDDVSLPGRLGAARARLLEDARLAAVGTRVRAVTAPSVAATGEGILRYVTWQNGLVTAADHAREIFVETPLCHPSVVMRRDALERVGGYHDAPWPQDWDLWLRFDAAGLALAKVPEVLFEWRHRPGRATFEAATTRLERLVALRAHYLAPRLHARGPFALWGAGKTGKHLARALEPHGVRPALFVDIDPRKIGRTARGLPIVGPEDAYASGLFLVAAVGEPGAREVLRARLRAAGRVEPEAVLFAA